jgi:hypothetical protein
MGNWRHIHNTHNLETGGVQGAHCGLPTWPRAINVDFQILDAVFLDHIAYSFGGDLRSEWRTLAGATEA